MKHLLAILILASISGIGFANCSVIFSGKDADIRNYSIINSTNTGSNVVKGTFDSLPSDINGTTFLSVLLAKLDQKNQLILSEKDCKDIESTSLYKTIDYQNRSLSSINKYFSEKGIKGNLKALKISKIKDQISNRPRPIQFNATTTEINFNNLGFHTAIEQYNAYFFMKDATKELNIE